MGNCQPAPRHALSQRNTAALHHSRRLQADLPQAQPRDEHLLSLFTSLGAAGPQAQPRPVPHGLTDHVIALDGCAFDRSR
jgi:4,5-DOPA dioxygenase extradiol